MDIVARYISDFNIIWLIGQVVRSFNSGSQGKGLPLGNLTSQLLVNVYMNEFDQYAKHELKAKYYARYADDFVFLSRDKELLKSLLPRIAEFLQSRLALSLHPDKVFIKTLSSGVDFLGWVHFTDHRVLRTSTKKRMLKRTTSAEKNDPTVQSYFGLLSHGNAEKLRQGLYAHTAPDE